ncbi:unnamed protein product [Caenorhabditis angaria]|uniref:Uncharacterized protein n=1 Tax=Caenorhabditis angaria TaxID=860376 RepID=A0A9P1N4L0_9PELO|nr:unnamed protein product [Caenorhabditis angaria]
MTNYDELQTIYDNNIEYISKIPVTGIEIWIREEWHDIKKYWASYYGGLDPRECLHIPTKIDEKWSLKDFASVDKWYTFEMNNAELMDICHKRKDVNRIAQDAGWITVQHNISHMIIGSERVETKIHFKIYTDNETADYRITRIERLCLVHSGYPPCTKSASCVIGVIEDDPPRDAFEEKNQDNAGAIKHPFCFRK